MKRVFGTRGEAILGLLNNRTDSQECKPMKKLRLNNESTDRTPNTPAYASLFDEGRWDELDKLLSESRFDAKPKKRMPWGNEYKDEPGQSDCNETPIQRNKRPRLARLKKKLLFDQISEDECEDERDFCSDLDTDDTDADKTWEPDDEEEDMRPSQIEKAFLATARSLKNTAIFSKPPTKSSEILSGIYQKEIKKNLKPSPPAHIKSQQLKNVIKESLHDTDTDETWKPDNNEENKHPCKIENAFVGTARPLTESATVSKSPITSSAILPEIDQDKIMYNEKPGPSYHIEHQPSTLNVIKGIPVLSTENLASGNNFDQKKKCTKQFSCFYCGQLVSKLPRHLERKHGDEIAVTEFLAYPKNSNKRSLLIDRIRNKGNFLHNNEVITTGKGSFIPKKNPSKDETNSINDFLPCKICRGFYKKKQLASHVRLCQSKNSESERFTASKRHLQASAALLLPGPIQIEKEFENKVFGIMKVDNIYREIRRDRLIVQFGAQLYNKFSAPEEKHLRTFISQKMRELGRLVLEIKKQDKSVSDLLSCMTTKNVTTVVNSINVVAGFDTDNATYRTPSVALKLGQSFKRCIEIAIGNSLRNDNEHQQKLLEKALRLFDEDMRSVSIKALRSLKKRKWNKPLVLPLTEDIKKISDYLSVEGEALMKEITEMPSKDLLRRLSENTLCSITCFNRKRVGDVERMDLKVCSDIRVGEVTSCILENLSVTEQQLVHCLRRVEVRGKGGRKVAVLLTDRTKRQIDILSKPMHRKLMKIREDNMQLFALGDSENTLRGCEVLKKYATVSKASRPDAVTSTKLRKHLATMTQLMNLQENELDVIATFMGHDIRVHREFYRLPENVMQVAKVSKVLLAMDRGDIGVLKDKNLSDLEVSLNEEVKEETDEEDELMEVDEPSTIKIQERRANSEIIIAQEVSNMQPKHTKNSNNINFEIGSIKKAKSSSVKKIKSPTKIKKQRNTPWSQEENLAVESFFHSFINNKIIPGKKDCEKAQNKHPVLKSRPWQQIKFKLKNMYNKNQM